MFSKLSQRLWNSLAEKLCSEALKRRVIAMGWLSEVKMKFLSKKECYGTICESNLSWWFESISRICGWVFEALVTRSLSLCL